MQVNITLFFQMINFFIAWFFLHILYFKPAIVAIDREEAERAAIDVQKETWRAYVATKQLEIAACWAKLKQFARQHMPGALPAEQSRRIHAESASEQRLLENPLDGSVHEKLVDELKEKIITEVQHVDL